VLSIFLNELLIISFSSFVIHSIFSKFGFSKFCQNKLFLVFSDILFILNNLSIIGIYLEFCLKISDSHSKSKLSFSGFLFSDFVLLKSQ